MSLFHCDQLALHMTQMSLIGILENKSVRVASSSFSLICHPVEILRRLILGVGLGLFFPWLSLLSS